MSNDEKPATTANPLYTDQSTVAWCEKWRGR